MDDIDRALRKMAQRIKKDPERYSRPFPLLDETLRTDPPHVYTTTPYVTFGQSPNSHTHTIVPPQQITYTVHTSGAISSGMGYSFNGNSYTINSNTTNP